MKCAVIVFITALLLMLGGGWVMTHGSIETPVHDRVAEECARVLGVQHTDAVARCITLVDR